MVACSARGLEERLDEHGLAAAAVVRLSESRALAAERTPDRVRVLNFQSDGAGDWQVSEIAGTLNPPEGSSANLFSLSGETGDEWNSFFYGTAPDNVSRVEVEGLDGTGGQVVDGAWVIAFRDRDLTPEAMRWQFVDALGGIVESGTGIFPPGS